MKYAALSLIALLSLPAFAKETTGLESLQKDSKIFYRCDSRGLDFDTASEMKESSPGKYTLTIIVSPTNLVDNCVVSIMDEESTGAELCFMDLFPSLAKDEAAVTEKSYSLAPNQGKSSFKVDYKSAGSRVVTFIKKSSTLRVEESAPILATNK